VPNGSCFAATQLQVVVSYIAKILRVDFVDLRKVRHVDNEDIDFDNMLERATRGFENVCQVLHDSMLQQFRID
jgi:hypothetical protein